MFTNPDRFKTFKPIKNCSSRVPKSRTVESSQARPFDLFILQQNASGGFKITEEFISSAGIKNNLQELMVLPSILENSEVMDKDMVWATVIALVVFEKAFKVLEDEWELIYNKSKKFINSKLSGHNITLSILIELVHLLLIYIEYIFLDGKEYLVKLQKIVGFLSN